MAKYQLNEKQQKQINNMFIYHPPKDDQAERYTTIREQFKELAILICWLTPEGREQAMALSQLQLANMLANSAIACGE